MSVYHMHAWCLRRPAEDIGSLGLELQMLVSAIRCWELNPGPLEEQQVLLTNEPSLQSLVWSLFFFFWFFEIGFFCVALAVLVVLELIL